MDSPHREVEPLLAKREVPGANVVVDAVDERAVEIEEESDRAAHVLANGACADRFRGDDTSFTWNFV
jgi:hypothetical protein